MNLNNLIKKNLIFSYNKFNIFSFYNNDHGNRDGKSLKVWVFENLKKFNIHTNINKSKVTLLPKGFWLCFQPIKCFLLL